jgi:hypothetical protein
VKTSIFSPHGSQIPPVDCRVANVMVIPFKQYYDSWFKEVMTSRPKKLSQTLSKMKS